MIDYLLCADWSKEQKGRALYAADVRKRAIYREATRPLTFDSALKRARELAEHGNVLLSFDLPLGLPRSYLSTLCNVPGWEGTTHFLDFLQRAVRSPSFFESCHDAGGWCVERPFFAVQKGEGGKQAFELAARNVGVQLRRRIDELTKGNPLFITSGIPGSVGSGTIDAWRALARHLTPERDFKVWPFEGPLPGLFDASTRIVVAENYPRAAYAAALSDLPGRRPRMRLAKTDPDLRRDALDHLRQRPWFTDHEVTIHGEEEARGDENEFDALMTTAGLLRVLLEGEPLYDGELADGVTEGCILGTGTLDLGGAEQNFRPTTPRLPNAARSARAAARRAERATPASGEPRTYACPILGCPKLFTGSRGGWDGHAGSLRNHSHWHPEVADHAERRALFRAEFPQFFS